jgi:photosystem II stability/assembly factor-like uncharacterized protein
MFVLIILMMTIGCAGPDSTATPLPVIATAMPTATVSPTLLPTVTPTIAPTPTPIPVKRSWQCDPSGGLACFDDLVAVDMLNAEEGWAVSTNGIVLHYTTAPGSTAPIWQRVEISQEKRPDRINFHALSAVSPNEWWGVQGSNIVHYQNGLLEDVPVPLSPQYLDIDMLSADEGWAVGDGGVIAHYNGDVWQNVPSPTDKLLYGINMLDAQKGWAVGPFGPLLQNDNQVWTEINLPTAKTIYDIDMINDQEGWAVGEALVRYHEGDWQEISHNLDYFILNSVNLINVEEGWAVGRGGYILHYSQGEWQRVESPTKNDLWSVNMVSPEEGWAVGSNSTILHYHNGVWELVDQATPPPGPLRDLAWLDNGEGWAVGMVGDHFTFCGRRLAAGS